MICYRSSLRAQRSNPGNVNNAGLRRLLLAMTGQEREAAGGLHRREQAQWRALYGRHVEPAATDLSAPPIARARLHLAIWLQASGLVRAPRRDAAGDRPREADQRRLPREEA